MANRVTWLPSTETDIASYRLESSATQTGTYAALATITHDLQGADYDSAQGVFFYDHAAGGTSTWYRLIAIDAALNESQPSTPFQAVAGASLSLASLSDLKAYLAITHNNDDALLSRLLLAASKWFESQIGRNVASALYTDTKSGNGSRVMVLDHYPVSAVSSVTINGTPITEATTYDASGWMLDHGTVKLRGYTFTAGTLNVVISYTAGEPSIPNDIQQAVIEVAADRYKARTRIGEVSKSIAGESVSFVSFQVPVSVQTVINTYQRISF